MMTTSLPLGFRAWISQPPIARMAASTSARRSGLACTRTLAISPPGGAITGSGFEMRPEIKARRSMAARFVVMSATSRLLGWRPRRPGDHLVGQDREALTTHGRDSEARDQHRR